MTTIRIPRSKTFLRLLDFFSTDVLLFDFLVLKVVLKRISTCRYFTLDRPRHDGRDPQTKSCWIWNSIWYWNEKKLKRMQSNKFHYWKMYFMLYSVAINVSPKLKVMNHRSRGGSQMFLLSIHKKISKRESNQ